MIEADGRAEPHTATPYATARDERHATRPSSSRIAWRPGQDLPGIPRCIPRRGGSRGPPRYRIHRCDTAIPGSIGKTSPIASRCSSIAIRPVHEHARRLLGSDLEDLGDLPERFPLTLQFEGGPLLDGERSSPRRSPRRLPVERVRPGSRRSILDFEGATLLARRRRGHPTSRRARRTRMTYRP